MALIFYDKVRIRCFGIQLIHMYNKHYRKNSTWSLTTHIGCCSILGTLSPTLFFVSSASVPSYSNTPVSKVGKCFRCFTSLSPLICRGGGGRLFGIRLPQPRTLLHHCGVHRGDHHGGCRGGGVRPPQWSLLHHCGGHRGGGRGGRQPWWRIGPREASVERAACWQDFLWSGWRFQRENFE